MNKEYLTKLTGILRINLEELNSYDVLLMKIAALFNTKNSDFRYLYQRKI